MPSTVIQSFDYRPEASELLITFTTGRRYLYVGVEEAVVEWLAASTAKGRFFNERIRDRYECRELTD